MSQQIKPTCNSGFPALKTVFLTTDIVLKIRQNDFMEYAGVLLVDRHAFGIIRSFIH